MDKGAKAPKEPKIKAIQTRLERVIVPGLSIELLNEELKFASILSMIPVFNFAIISTLYQMIQLRNKRILI